MGREIPIPATAKQTIAAFDFDGTITRNDTLLHFIYYAFKYPKLFANSLKFLPIMVLFKLKLMKNDNAKERLFKIFFKGFKIDKLNKLSIGFTERIEAILNPEAMERIHWHQEMGHIIVIISASPENWIKPWANKNNINTVLSTKLQVVNNIVTGSFLSKNCYGSEKVNRLLQEFPNRENYVLYAYGDSNGDKELLSLADYSYYRKFS